jgi:hypothetical protein
MSSTLTGSDHWRIFCRTRRFPLDIRTVWPRFRWALTRLYSLNGLVGGHGKKILNSMCRSGEKSQVVKVDIYLY